MGNIKNREQEEKSAKIEKRPDTEEGIIVKGIGGFYDVAVGNDIVCCKARGRFRKENLIPLVGDSVKISIRDEAVEEILPRKNQLIRPPVANIDNLGIMISITMPEPDFFLVDKLMISSRINKIQPILLINKIDLADGESYEQIRNEYSKSGCLVFLISCQSGEGIDKLQQVLTTGITTFAGQSGVGKSSLINKLCNGRVLETGKLSTKAKRGKHTTRHVELLSLSSGGMVVDTPGFSAMNMEELAPKRLQYYYPEFIPYLGQCRFIGCIHYHEPQCKVKEMVKKGEIPKERYERYLKIYEEIKENRRDIW